MTQYIDKSVLVAEIDRWIELLTNEKSQEGVSQIDKLSLGGRIAELQEVKVFLDTLEVKEVDLEKHLKEDIEDLFFDLDGVAIKGATRYITVEDIKDIAKHFFELGLKAQKGESV